MRSVTVLAGGTALAQVLAALSSIILAWLYDPGDFGLLAVYMSLITLLAPVLSLRYELAIPLPPTDEEAQDVLALSVLLVVVLSALTAVGISVGGDQLVALMKSPGLRAYLGLLPLTVLGLGFYQVLSYWAIRKNAVGIIAKTKLMQQVWGTLLVSVPFGLVNSSTVGLVLGYSVTQVSGATSLLRTVDVRSLLATLSWTSLRRTANRYKRFPLFTMWGGLVNTVGLHVPVLLLTNYFSADVVGHYSLALRVLGLPLTVIGQAVSQVFYRRAAQIADSDELAKFTEQIAVALLTVSVLLVGIVSATGARLFSAVLGNTWNVAGYYAQILSPWYALLLLSSPLSTLTLVKQKQGTALIIAVCEVLLRIGVVLMGGAWLQSAAMSVALLSLSGVIISGASICYTMYLAGTSVRSVLRQLKRVTAVSTVVSVALWWVSRYLNGLLVTVLAGSLLVALLLHFSRGLIRSNNTLGRATD